MFLEQEEILVKIFESFFDRDTGERLVFSEKDLIKRKIISKMELDDFDELFDEGLVDVSDMTEVIDGSKEIEYVLSKEAIEYLKSK